MTTFTTKTSQQTFASSAGGMLPKILTPAGVSGIDYHLLKCIALHPIVRLGIELIVGIVAKSPWRVVANENSPFYGTFDDDAIQSIQLGLQTNLDQFRDEILNTALRNQIIFGWQAFERIMGWDKEQERFVVKELKPLLQEFTYILTDKAGNYIGVRNIPPTDGKQIDLPESDVVLFNIDVIGQNWYGTPLLLSAVEPYLALRKLDIFNEKFLDRISSVNAVVKYPIGKETLQDGTEVNNYDLAVSLAEGLDKYASVVIPQATFRGTNTVEMDSLNATPWEIQFVNPTTPAVGNLFKDNKDKLESLLINALGLPSRVVLDGKFGSYSSNETYRETTYDILQSRNNRLIQVLNKQFLDPILSLNYDAPGLFYIQAAPMDDDHVQTMFRMYSQIKDNPKVDIDAVHQTLGIPDTDTSDKFIDVEGSEPAITTQPDIGGIWLTSADLAGRLGMSNTSIRSQIKRFKANEPEFVGCYKGCDGRYRINSQYVKEVFGLPMDIDLSEGRDS